MASVTFSHTAKFYGDSRVLHDIDLHISSGELIVMVGPSGCGKSTLLRMVAGIENISEGTIEIGGNVVNDIPPSERGIAMVFQNYALYPHMSVRDNLSFSMKIHHETPDQIESKVQKAAEFLGLEPYLDRLPKALSGGQRQRVAIGRAIVRNPEVFLFDEPLSNLDAALRVATRLKLANLKDNLPDTTMIYVTHDQVEAMTLADRIVVLSADGGIEQVGTPLDLYLHPANLFVARFIGSPAMNILPATLIQAGDHTQVKVATQPAIEVPIRTEAALEGATLQFGVRPEDLSITDSDDWLIEGKVVFVESLGDVTQVYLDLGLEGNLGREREEQYLVVKLSGIVNPERGTQLRLSVDVSRVHLFDESGATLAVVATLTTPSAVQLSSDHPSPERESLPSIAP